MDSSHDKVGDEGMPQTWGSNVTNFNVSPKRNLGFWIISAWRHVMVTTWCLPMFMLGFYHHPSKALIGWLIAIGIDIFAAFRAPDMRLKHANIVSLLSGKKKQICLITSKDIFTRAVVLGVVVVYILYLTHCGYRNTITHDKFKELAVVAVAAAITFISLAGIQVRTIDELPAEEKPFATSANPRFALTNKRLLLIFGCSCIFYFFSMFAVIVYIRFSQGWEGSESLLIVSALFAYVIFLLIVSLTPAAYAMSKLKPYLDANPI